MTAQKPILSIIIPAFQAGKTLDMALKSIVSQQFDAYEVLIMDGGSTDQTASVAATYQSRFPAIFFYSEPDKGIYDAMNRGIARAKGEWIYFLGSDDELFDVTVLDKVFSNPDNRKQDVLYGQVFLLEKETLYAGEFDAEKLVFRNISHQAIFTKSAVFQKLGTYDLQYKICADHIFNVKWFFDNTIRKKYIDIVVAKFAQQGVSSQRDDLDKVRDLPGLVRRHGGRWLYFRFYYIRPILEWFRKKIRSCKKLFLRFAPITI